MLAIPILPGVSYVNTGTWAPWFEKTRSVTDKKLKPGLRNVLVLGMADVKMTAQIRGGRQHMGDRVAGKVAIITGGASGIGRACAERLAEEGAAVVVTVVDLEVAVDPALGVRPVTRADPVVALVDEGLVHDARKLSRFGIDALWVPDADQMYPEFVIYWHRA